MSFLYFVLVLSISVPHVVPRGLMLYICVRSLFFVIFRRHKTVETKRGNEGPNVITSAEFNSVLC